MAEQQEPELTDLPEHSRDIDREYAELWSMLDDSLLGRSGGVWVETGQQAYSKSEQEQMGVELPDQTRREFVRLYHALPVDQEGTRHILLTPEGEMLLVERERSEDRVYDEKRAAEYESAFSEDGTFSPMQEGFLKTMVSEGKNLRNTLQNTSHFFNVNVIKSSYEPRHTDEVQEAFETALRTAQERLDRIQRVKQESKTKTVDGLSRLFGSSDNPPHTPPEKED